MEGECTDAWIEGEWTDERMIGQTDKREDGPNEWTDERLLQWVGSDDASRHLCRWTGRLKRRTAFVVRSTHSSCRFGLLRPSTWLSPLPLSSQPVSLLLLLMLLTPNERKQCVLRRSTVDSECVWKWRETRSLSTKLFRRFRRLPRREFCATDGWLGSRKKET